MHYHHFRRAIEIILVLLVAPPALLLGLLVALIVASDSTGGPFFIQIRPGKHGRPFRMIKFRTMTVVQQGPFRLTEAGDKRLTGVGKWLRDFHLDEIPQLWHVLKGEMSLIGPRPVPMELYAGYLENIAGYDDRHAVAPGITGLAQVSLGYVNTLEGERDKWRYDVFYIAQRSAALDAWILWATAAKLWGVKLKPASWFAEGLIQKTPPDCSGSA